MVRLYKHDRNGLLYMECWKDKDFAVVHFGHVGQTGKKRSYCTLEGRYSLFEEQFEEENTRNGYYPICEKDMFWVVASFEVVGIKDMENLLDLKDDLEFTLNEMLGWHGVGYLDGFETAPAQPGKVTATLDFFALVVDAEIAVRLLRESQSIDSRVTLREIKSRPVSGTGSVGQGDGSLSHEWDRGRFRVPRRK